jgi:hypothetical protein
MREVVLACGGGSRWDCIGRAEVFVGVARWGGRHGRRTSLREIALEHRDVLLCSVSSTVCVLWFDSFIGSRMSRVARLIV